MNKVWENRTLSLKTDRPIQIYGYDVVHPHGHLYLGDAPKPTPPPKKEGGPREWETEYSGKGSFIYGMIGLSLTIWFVYRMLF